MTSGVVAACVPAMNVSRGDACARVRRSAVRAGSLVTFMALGLVARSSSAADPVDPTVELEYVVASGIPDCLSRSDFEDAVRTRLAGTTWAAHEAIAVSTRIEPEGERLRATVILRERGEAGRWTEVKQEIFAAPHECATLSATAALAASLTIRRSLAYARSTQPAPSELRPPPLPPGPSSASKRPESPAAPPPARPPTPHERKKRPEIRTHLLVVGGYDIQPSPSVGSAFGASVKFEPWSAGLEAGAWLPAVITTPSGRGGGKAWLVFSSASACVHPGPLFVCGVGTIGRLRAFGMGQLHSRSGASTYVAMGVRVGTEIVVASPFSLVVHGTALSPLLRPSLRIGDELLWRAPLVGAEVGIGLRVSIL